MNLEEICTKIEWVIPEMKNHGMCFYEGFITEIDKVKLRENVTQLVKNPYNATLDLSTWSNEASKEEMEGLYSAQKYVDFFETGKLMA